VARGVGDPARVLEINRAYEQQARTVRNLTQQYRAANREAVSVSRTFGTLNADVTRLGGSFATMADRILPNWRIVFTASVAGAVVALGALAKTSAVALDNLDDMAKATGTTTQQIEALQLVATKAGDQGFEDINKALERTTRAMGAAQIEAEKTKDVFSFTFGKRDFSDPFKALGIDVTRFKDPLLLLEEFAKRLDRESNAAIKASLAADVFGKSWARVLPTLTNLREEMAQAEQDIARGGGFTGQASIAAVNNFLAALGKLELLFGRIRNAAGAALGAALTPAIEQLTAFVQQNMAQISAFIVNAAGYIKALTNDLIKFFVLGQPGQQTQFGADIINAVLYIKNDLIPGLTSAFNTVMAVLNQVAGVINSIFGTKLTGGEVGIAAVILSVSGAFTTLAAAVTVLVPLVAAGGAIFAAFTPAGWLIAGIVALNAVTLTLTDSWKTLGDTIKSVADNIAGGMQIAWNWLTKTAGQIANMPAPTGAAARPMATGGLVPGSGNRDTFPARLMPGEFVIRKSIVAALGADFFAGLNRGMGSLLPHSHYATGGLVTAEPAGGGTPVHLHIGGGSFPLNGAPAVVSALVVEAHRQHIRSAGQKPSWYGGR
jgi:hypothetical protein